MPQAAAGPRIEPPVSLPSVAGENPAATAAAFGYVPLANEGWRLVVMRLGRWPGPRLFVDTLLLDESGRHWAALAPDPSERTLEVWIDGEPRATVDPEELGSALAARDGQVSLGTVAAAIVEGELARYLSAPTDADGQQHEDPN